MILLRSVVLCFLLPGVAAFAQQPSAVWIQSSGASPSNASDAFGGAGCLRTIITLQQPVASATLRACGDMTSADIFIDGDRIAQLEPFDPILDLDVTDRLGAPKFAIAIELAPSKLHRSACFVQLDFTLADGSHHRIVSDPTWRSNERPVAGWTTTAFDDSTWPRCQTLQPVDTRLLIPEARGINVDAAENYDQWKRAIRPASVAGDGGSATEQASAPTATFEIAEDFEIELLRQAQKDEDSWVSMAVDPKGRLILAKEQVGLLRMTLADDGSVADVQTVNNTMKVCRGLLFIGNDLYVNANNSKGLYRLPAGDEDQFGEPELIFASSGGVGHGRNDLALGPDGKIYSIHGDSVDLPIDCKDFTSPVRGDRRGDKTSQGHVLRIDPKTKEVEIWASGLRNPFGIDFNPRGDCFTYDADAEHDMGAPWYRPTRVLHLQIGGDYGWRGVTGQWPPYYPDHPDNAPPGLDIGKGSPTAVKFGTRSNFPARYRDALFILDWTYGRVIAVHTIPRGSSYLMSAETFLQGRPLNVTDLDFGPDGSMYLITGGRKTQSALYRVRYVGKNPVDIASNAPPEMATGSWWQNFSEQMWLAQVPSDDPWLRTLAQNQIENLGTGKILPFQDNELHDGLERDESMMDSYYITWALLRARNADPAYRPTILQRLLDVDWPAMSRSWREMAVYSLLLTTADWQLDDAADGQNLKARLLAQLDSVYPDREYRVNRMLGELLVRLKSKSVVGKTLDMAIGATNQAEQMHCLFVLRDATEGWTLDDRKRYFRLLAVTRDYIGGQGMNDFVSKIRNDAIDSLSASQRHELADVIALSESKTNAKSSLAPARPIVQTWTVPAITDALDKLNRPVDPERGKALFSLVSCVHCHRMGTEGRLVGPDLTNVGRRFSRHDLLDTIINPSHVVPEKYQSTQVLTNDGHAYVGLTILSGDYRSTKLRLATNPADPYDITEIEKDNIQQTQPSPISWMPTGLLDTLTPTEVADLLSYLVR